MLTNTATAELWIEWGKKKGIMTTYGKIDRIELDLNG
jgi:hypothetical protein